MSSLKKNTFYLYILTASNYLFSLATLPYLTRILGPSIFGNLSFAMALGVYFNIVLDMGFILSGTKRVAENVNDKRELSKIFTSIIIIKVVLLVIIASILYLTSSYVEEIHANIELITLFLFASFFSSLLPDYLYRGMEEMRILTYRGVFTRGIFTILIFCFLKKDTQVVLVPIFNIIGGFIVLMWILWDLYNRHNLRICVVKFSYVKNLLFETFPYFTSRIASSIYNVTNTVILGLISPGNPVVGYYSSAERFKSIASQGCSPLADSFYPYMIRTKNFKKLIKVTVYFEGLILIMCIIVFIIAPQICTFVFGSQFNDAYILLRWMLPMIAIILPSYMFGFPALTPLNKTKWANISIEIAMLNQLIGLCILFYLKNITAINLCILTLISEFIVVSIRIVCFIIGYHTVISNK